MLFVYFGIDVAVDQQEIGPTVIVEIEKHGAPAEILGVQAEAGVKSDIVEGAIAVVAIERGSVVGEIGFENVQVAVAVEIRNGGTHASLFFSVFVESRARKDGYIGEGAVAIVVVEHAGSAVAGDKNVRPTVFVKIQRGYTEGVVAIGLIDVGFLGDVFDGAVATIVVKEIRSPWQAARTAHDRHALPQAIGAFARLRRIVEIEIDVGGDEKIELAVTIVVDESATG